VEDGSPAALAGVRAGDLLVRVGDRELATADDLFAALDADDGDMLVVSLLRGSDELSVTVSFG
jgi:S1-C subfamily serine protease